MIRPIVLALAMATLAGCTVHVVESPCAQVSRVVYTHDVAHVTPRPIVRRYRRAVRRPYTPAPVRRHYRPVRP